MSTNVSITTIPETGGAAGASSSASALVPGYTGPLKDGVPHGMGKRILTNGRVEEGNFVNGQLHGRGKIIYPSGSIFEGQFNHGERRQFGTKRYTNGAVHIGFFNGEKTHGPGKLEIEGKRYEGNFKDNKADGLMKIICEDGRHIERRYEEGKAAQTGSIVFSNGVRYEGRIKNMMPYGRGVWHFAEHKIPDSAIEFKTVLSFETNYLHLKSGGYYFGETLEGEPHGKGIAFYPKGCVVYGNYNYGKLHGWVVMHIGPTGLYQGEMNRGVFHGYGECTTPEGSWRGQIKKGKFTIPGGKQIVIPADFL